MKGHSLEQARGPGKEQPWTGPLKLMNCGCWSCSQQGPGREVTSKTVGRKEGNGEEMAAQELKVTKTTAKEPGSGVF